MRGERGFCGLERIASACSGRRSGGARRAVSAQSVRAQESVQQARRAWDAGGQARRGGRSARWRTKADSSAHWTAAAVSIRPLAEQSPRFRAILSTATLGDQALQRTGTEEKKRQAQRGGETAGEKRSTRSAPSWRRARATSSSAAQSDLPLSRGSVNRVSKRARGRDGKGAPMSFVSNWYTPIRTPAVASRRPQAMIRPSTGNLRGCR